jgi:hypothetical protein
MSALAKTLRFDESSLWVDLTDGRTVGVPLAWFPRVLHATGEQLAGYELSGGGADIHWEDLDEDILVEGLLTGRGDHDAPPRRGLITANCPL